MNRLITPNALKTLKMPNFLINHCSLAFNRFSAIITQFVIFGQKAFLAQRLALGSSVVFRQEDSAGVAVEMVGVVVDAEGVVEFAGYGLFAGLAGGEALEAVTGLTE